MNQMFFSEKTTKLSIQEQKVLELLLKGLANKQIALELQVCEKTVEKHLTSIYRKFGVTSRTEAILLGTKR